MLPSVPSFVLIALLASTVLIASTPRTPHRQGGRRFYNHLGQRADTPLSNPMLDPIWAGAVWDEPNNGTFVSVVGDFVVPNVTGKIGDAVTIWLGIDGNTCYGGGLFQAGIDCIIGDDGTTVYSAWVEWFPAFPVGYPKNLPISAGDVIKVNITAYSATSGIATIVNQTRNQTVSQDVNSTYVLCQQGAEWIVEDFMSNRTYDAFAKFSPVVFTHARATGPTGTHSPYNAQVLDIQKNGGVLTSVTYNKTSLTISHV